MNLSNDDKFVFWVYGVIGAIVTEFFIYMIFIVINVRFHIDSYYNTWALLAGSFNNALPVMTFGLLFYCAGFAFRGKERKALSVNLERMDNAEKAVYIAIMKKSMDPQKLLEDNRGIPEKFLPGYTGEDNE